MDRQRTALGTNDAHSAALRGGQVFFHNARMMMQIISRVLLLCVAITSAIALGYTYWQSDRTDSYMLTVREMARMDVMTGHGDREVLIKVRGQPDVVMTASEVLSNAVINRRAEYFIETALNHVLIGVGVGLFVFVLMLAWFIKKGRVLGSDRFVRGAQLIKDKELKTIIDKHNNAARKRYKTKRYKPYELAGVPYAWRSETTHTMFLGTTGAGKSQLYLRLLKQIRDRGDRAIVYDKMRTFIPAFYDTDKGDHILNPVDERCSSWTPFSDARSMNDFRQLAASIIPQNPNSNDPFWDDSARLVFACTAEKLARQNRRDLNTLLHYLMKAPLSELADFLEDTLAASTMSTDIAKTAMSIRATMQPRLASLEAMNKPGADARAFSIRDWVKDEDAGSWLFMSSRSDQHEMMRPLISTWMDIALNAIMAQERDPDRTIWIILDELPSLNKLPTLEAGLAEGRQYGAAYVVGLQSLSQLESIYRKESAKTITGLCRTKVILNLADPETAKAASAYIGRAETQRAQRSVSFGAASVRDGNSFTLQDKMDEIVMAEDLMRLENLSGFLIPALDAPSASIKIKYQSPPTRCAGFIPRVDDPDDIDWQTITPLAPSSGGLAPGQSATGTNTGAPDIDPDTIVSESDGGEEMGISPEGQARDEDVRETDHEDETPSSLEAEADAEIDPPVTEQAYGNNMMTLPADFLYRDEGEGR